MISLRCLPALLIGFWFFIFGGCFNAEIYAQQKTRDVYVGFASVLVKGENYVLSRKKAVELALKDGLQEAIKEIIGDEEYEESQRDLRKILRRSSHFVKSYRTLEAYDDQINKISEVELEMRFFRSAVNQALEGVGVIASSSNKKKVALLINEKSFTFAPVTSFWDIIPISENQLASNLIESGIEVVGRDELRELISEKMVLKAIKGDRKSARKIGLEVGADIVVVGTAVSSLREENVKEGTKTVQTNINVKVISTLESLLIAAKTEFSTIKHEHASQAEIEAFDIASKKLSGFLASSFHRYWEKGVEVPMKKTSEIPPISMSDM
ncbi:MAG TPA: hypothetical protein EYF96_03255 [Nitrospinaceae bacterium]|nr:hypothetical protein [Nitrospinaceae bacterium]